MPKQTRSEIAKSGTLPVCGFSADVQVLTNSGWVRFADLSTNSVVARYLPESQQISFGPIVALEARRYHGQLTHLETRFASILGSAQMPLTVYAGPDRNQTATPLGKPRDNVYITHAGRYAGGKGLDIDDNLLRLATALTVVGRWARTDGKLFGAEFYLREGEQLARLKEISGIEAKPVCNDGRERFSIYIPVKHPWIAQLRSLLGDKRSLGKWIFDLTSHQLALVRSEIEFWKINTKRSPQMHMLTSKRRALHEWYQIIMLLSNCRSVIGEFNSSQRTLTYLGRNQSKPKFVVSVPTYQGKLYQCRIASGLIILRHNGKVVITRGAVN